MALRRRRSERVATTWPRHPTGERANELLFDGTVEPLEMLRERWDTFPREQAWEALFGFTIASLSTHLGRALEWEEEQLEVRDRWFDGFSEVLRDVEPHGLSPLVARVRVIAGAHLFQHRISVRALVFFYVGEDRVGPTAQPRAEYLELALQVPDIGAPDWHQVGWRDGFTEDEFGAFARYSTPRRRSRPQAVRAPKPSKVTTSVRAKVDGHVEILKRGVVVVDRRFRVGERIEIGDLLAEGSEIVVSALESTLALCPALTTPGWMVLLSLRRRAALSLVDSRRDSREVVSVRHGGDVMPECAQWIVNDERVTKLVAAFARGKLTPSALGEFAIYDGGGPELGIAARALAERELGFGEL